MPIGCCSHLLDDAEPTGTALWNPIFFEIGAQTQPAVCDRSQRKLDMTLFLIWAFFKNQNQGSSFEFAIFRLMKEPHIEQRKGLEPGKDRKNDLKPYRRKNNAVQENDHEMKNAKFL